ncbi:MAG: putative salt-induced outer membrane protein [Paraglaciecola sp.]|jgi:putative salt-induced outer membrane protein
MRKFCLILTIFSFSSHAKINIMHLLYLADEPSDIATSNDEKSTTGEFGMLFTEGNTNTSTLTAKINTSRELTDWSYQIIGDLLYRQNKKEIDGELTELTSAQNIFLSSQVDYKLTNPDHRLFLYAEYEDKRFNEYRYQAAIAAGWSARLWHDETSEFRYSIGPGYVISEVADELLGTDKKSVILRAAMEYKHKISGLATFRQFVSSEVNQLDTRTKSETSLSTKINSALAMKLSFIMNHNSAVEADKEELDTETAVTLVYQFF